MALYENVFIARQDVPTTQVEALTNQFAELVTGLGGTVSKKEYWGLRSLTYRIKKNRKGHYMLLAFESKPAAVTEMERQLAQLTNYRTDYVSRSEQAPGGVDAVRLQNFRSFLGRLSDAIRLQGVGQSAHAALDSAADQIGLAGQRRPHLFRAHNRHVGTNGAGQTSDQGFVELVAPSLGQLQIRFDDRYMNRHGEGSSRCQCWNSNGRYGSDGWQCPQHEPEHRQAADIPQGDATTRDDDLLHWVSLTWCPAKGRGSAHVGILAN